MTVLRAADTMRGIVQWDLSAYQPDVTVTAARMRFNVSNANANLLVSIHQAIQSGKKASARTMRRRLATP